MILSLVVAVLGTTLQIGEARISVEMDESVTQDHAMVVAWVSKAARATATYFGGFPAKPGSRRGHR